MKRFLVVFLILLLLAGCGREEILPLNPTEVTEPAIPWVQERGMAWDAAGVLKEIPLTIPDGLHYTAAMEFDGDLLLWSIDDHLEECVLELCLVELDDGSVAATADVPTGQFVSPQCLGDTLYLCDGSKGLVTALDKTLEIGQQWQIEQTEDSLVMGANGMLYRNVSEKHLMRYDLSTGEAVPALEGDPTVSWVRCTRGKLIARCFLPDTGAMDFAVVDLTTGDDVYADIPRGVDDATVAGDTWLYETYGENYIYDLQCNGAERMRIRAEGNMIGLKEEGWLLQTSADSTVLSLHELDGRMISACRISARESGYIDSTMIWNERLGGYFLMVRNYDETARLLFWDVSKTDEGSDLAMEPAPKPEETQLRLEERAMELSRKFGVNILVGDQCETEYDEFSATQATNFEKVSEALTTLERALGAYPEGFFHQLRYDTVYSITIQLIRDLQANGSGRTGGGYNAFTQVRWEDALVVIDIEDSSEQTYYHEVSHIIDKYLEWDAGQRDDALYAESGWSALNPNWFGGYTYDYSWEQSLNSDGAFVDGYATISPTEDRARVMEYAMLEWGDYQFRQGTVLARKLDYYCRCIRDAFDTEGWTKAPLWEQYRK